MTTSRQRLSTYCLTSICIQLHDRYQDFVTASEIEEFAAKLQEVEDWLYEDGEDETKGVYVAKLEELKRVYFSSVIIFFATLPNLSFNKDC